MNADAPKSPASPDGLLARLEWLLILAGLTATVLVYPLRLRPEWLGAIQSYMEHHDNLASSILRTQVEPFVFFLFSPITLKMIVAAWGAVAMLAIWAARGALGSAGGANGPDLARRAWLRSTPGRQASGLGWLAFFLWAGASAFWSPTPGLATQALYFVALFGIFGWALMRRGFTPAEAKKLGAVMIGLGAIVMALAYAEAIEALAPVTFSFFERFDDIRNRFGSLMGHNTSASILLVTSCFFALAFALNTRRRGVKIFNLVFIALAMGCVLIEQSRSGWVLGAVMGTLAVRSAIRNRRISKARQRWLPTAVLAAITLAVLSQAVDHPANPFFFRENPLSLRLKDLTPQRLMVESRVRLNYLSPRLIAQRPLRGHGLFAFQYVFPKVQGEYFSTHPDSPLYETDKRAHMAHNEYMQIAVDHGLIGLALALLALGEIAVRGIRRRRKLDGEEKLLHEAFGWGALIFGLHALVDFPFHIPQLAAPGMLCLFVWAGWRDGVEEAGALAEIPAPDGAPEPASEAALRPAHLARLLMALTILAAAAPAMAPFGRMLQADVEYCRAEAWYQSYQAQARNSAGADPSPMLTRALTHIKRSLALEPANALGHQYMATICFGVARQLIGQWRAARGSEPQAELDRRRAEAAAMLDRAQSALKHAALGLDNHSIYYLQALILEQRNLLAPNPDLRLGYMSNLEMSVRYSSAFTPALHGLAEALVRQPNPPWDRITELRRRIWRRDRNVFRHEYVDPASRYFAMRLYDRAIAAWTQVCAVDPTVMKWQFFLGESYFFARRPAEAKKVFEGIRESSTVNFDHTLSPVYLAAIDHDLPAMKRAIDDWSLYFGIIYSIARMRALELELYPRLGLKPPEPGRFVKPDDQPDTLWERLLVENKFRALYNFLDDPGAAAEYLREVDAAPDSERLDFEFWLDGFWCAREIGDAALAETCVKRARADRPGYPALPQFDRMLKAMKASKARQTF